MLKKTFALLLFVACFPFSVLDAKQGFLSGYILESSEDSRFLVKKGELFIKKPIIYNSENKIQSDTLTIALDKNQEINYAAFKGGVKGNYKDININANSLKYSKSINALVLEAKPNERVSIENAESIVKTNKVEVDLNNNTVILRGNVAYNGLVENSDYKITSDTVLINLKQENNKQGIENIRAIGNVVLTDGESKVVGESAYFNKSNNLLEINGDTVTFQSKDGATIEACGVIVNTLTKKNKIVPCNKVIKGTKLENWKPWIKSWRY